MTKWEVTEIESGVHAHSLIKFVKVINVTVDRPPSWAHLRFTWLSCSLRKLMKILHLRIMLTPEWAQDGLMLILEFTVVSRTDSGFRISVHASWL